MILVLYNKEIFLIHLNESLLFMLRDADAEGCSDFVSDKTSNLRICYLDWTFGWGLKHLHVVQHPTFPLIELKMFFQTSFHTLYGRILSQSKLLTYLGLYCSDLTEYHPELQKTYNYFTNFVVFLVTIALILMRNVGSPLREQPYLLYQYLKNNIVTRLT